MIPRFGRSEVVIIYPDIWYIRWIMIYGHTMIINDTLQKWKESHWRVDNSAILWSKFWLPEIPAAHLRQEWLWPQRDVLRLCGMAQTAKRSSNWIELHATGAGHEVSWMLRFVALVDQENVSKRITLGNLRSRFWAVMFSQSKKLPIGGMSGRLIKLPMLALTANQCRYQNQRFPSAGWCFPKRPWIYRWLTY